MSLSRKLVGSIAAVGLALSLAGCGDDTNATNSVNNNKFDKTASIQGTVFDATTGARLGGTDLDMVLIQGITEKTPSRIIRTKPSLVGDYGFTGIPVAFHEDNYTVKMVVEKTGYQRFEGLLNLAAGFNTNDNSDLVSSTLDENYNFVVDIFLFAEGQTAPDYRTTVEFDQEPVSGATVLLNQNIGSTSATANFNSPTRLFATTGYLGSQSGTTDANGQVTFPGANLVLGGNYTPVVLPIVREGVQLARTSGSSFTVGTTNNEQVISMGDLSPGNESDGVYATSATNRDVDDITGLTNPGRVVITFNRPVELVPIANVPFSVILTNAGGAVLDAPSATGSLSADGLTLTVDPVFTTAPVAADTNMSATFSGGAIRMPTGNDNGDQAIGVFTIADSGPLAYLDGTNINRVVNITGP